MSIREFAAVVVGVSCGLISGVAHASSHHSHGGQNGTPQCMDSNSSQAIPVDNSQVVAWKSNTQNEFEARGHVQGTLTQVYPDQSGHHHFEIQIGSGSAGLIEIIYNEGFDQLPTLSPGMTVEACGDYITSYANADGYKASPDGALIHWVHRTDTAKHPAGFLIINGQVYQ